MNDQIIFTGKSAAALGKNRAVMFSSSVEGGVAVTTGATVEVAGVTLDASTAADQAVRVQANGFVDIVASGALALGDYVACTNAGAAAATTAAGAKVFGIVTRAAGDGEIARIFLRRFTIAV